MDKKTEFQFETTFSILRSNDLFTIHPLQRYQRLTKFFNLCRTHKDAFSRCVAHSGVLEKACVIWKETHKKLCISDGECIKTFLGKRFTISNHFFDYCMFVIELVLEWSLSEEKLFDKLSMEANQHELIKAIKGNCHAIPTKICYKYLHLRVIPAIFSPQTSNDERKELCDLIFSMPMGFAYEYMSKDEQKQFKHDIINQYRPFINSASNAFHQDWHQMCKVLIHYSGRFLHVETDVTNAILKVVEQGFKNATVEARCAAYECWKVVIENYSLDSSYLKIDKHTNLLMKPIKVRLSRNRIVALKRYDTYVHLLQHLDFSERHLELFLTAAFGPFETELSDLSTGDIVTDFRDINSTCPKSTEILLKVLGHDKPSCDCYNKTLAVTDIFKVRASEVPYNWETLVNSVRLCSQLNYNILKNENEKTIVKCLWKSLFKLSKDDRYKKHIVQNLKVLQLAIAKILNCSYMCKNYYDTFLKLILQCVVNYLYLDDDSIELNVYNELILPTVKELIIFQHNYPDKLPTYVYNDCVIEFFIYCKDVPQFFDQISLLMESGPYKCQLAADTLVFGIDFFAKSGKKDDNVLTMLFTNLIKVNSNQNIIAPEFDTDIEPLIMKRPTILYALLEEMYAKQQTIGVLKVASSLIKWTVTESEVSVFNYDFYCSLLSLIAKCLTRLDTLSTVDMKYSADLSKSTHALEQSITQIVKVRAHHFNIIVEHPKLVNIIMQTLTIGAFNMLDPLALLLDTIPRHKVPQELPTIIATILKQDVGNKQALRLQPKLISSDDTSTNKSIHNLPLSPRIRALADRDRASSLNASRVRLFGEYFDSPSPKQARGTLLERTTPADSNKGREKEKAREKLPCVKRALKPIDDLSESAFIAVDKEVVVDASKLSDHQKEVAKKRREDIPALYSELTQTQSQSMDFGKFAPQSTENDTCENLNGNASVDKRKTRGRSKFVTLKDPFVDSPRASLIGMLDEQGELEPKELPGRAKRELDKLSMNIVGGNSFVNLPRSRQRRSRIMADMIDSQVIPFIPEQQTSPCSSSSSTKTEDKINCDNDGFDKEKNTGVDETEKVNLEDPEDEIDTEVEIQIKDTVMTAYEQEAPVVDVAPSTDGSDPDIISPSQPIGEIRVNLFRLPQLSPTKQELDEAMKVQECIKPTPGIPTKLNFAALIGKLRNTHEKKIRKKRISPRTLQSETKGKLRQGQNDKRLRSRSHTGAKSADETLTLDLLPPVTDGAVALLDTESFMDSTISTSMHLQVSATESQLEASDVDVAKNCGMESTPKKNIQGVLNTSLLASPITDDTLSRTKELLDSTLDISPIKSDESQQNGGAIDVDVLGDVKDGTPTLKNPGTRSAKLLNLIGQSPAQADGQTPKMTAVRHVAESSKISNTSSPTTDRIKKMMRHFPEAGAPRDKPAEKLNQNDILEFERAVPSPLAVPRSSILKRKTSDFLEDGLSPCAKRKRVNFPDPPTTCEKVYFKEVEEKQMIRRKRRSFNKLLNEAQGEGDAPTGMENGDGASNAIQSMEMQVNGLYGVDGVAPLDPQFEEGNQECENPVAKLNGMPANPPPEMLAAGSFDSADLFPVVKARGSINHKKVPEAPPSRQSKEAVDMFIGMYQVAKQRISDSQEFLNTSILDLMPTETVEKWLKQKKEKETHTYTET